MSEARASLLERAVRAVGARALHDALTPGQRELLKYSWEAQARPLVQTGIRSFTGQLPPPGDWWSTWLFIAGRRSGKTWTGAHWVQQLAELDPGAVIALVGATAKDARRVMVFGKTGIMRLAPPWFRPRWFQTDQMLVWPNGAQAPLYSAEEPERLRGPEHTHAWADELCAWAYPETFDMLSLTMSGGLNPRMLITTTPKRSKILDDLIGETSTALTRGTTYDNAANLPKAYFEKLVRRYEGTSLGRQELEAELRGDVDGALFVQSVIDKWRVKDRPELRRIVVAVDPSLMTFAAGKGTAASEEKDRALCGIVVAGIDAKGEGYVIADLSKPATPREWASIAISALVEFHADRIVYEVNHGGKSVSDVFLDIDRNLPLKAVNARRGKFARAEPVAALYERGRVHHVGGATRPRNELDRTLCYLEDQMCSWTPDQRRSPDRLDALVYALTELMLSGDVPLIFR